MIDQEIEKIIYDPFYESKLINKQIEVQNAQKMRI